MCISRELNPGIQLGRLTCYHYITEARKYSKQGWIALNATIADSGFKRTLPIGLACVIIGGVANPKHIKGLVLWKGIRCKFFFGVSGFSVFFEFLSILQN